MIDDEKLIPDGFEWKTDSLVLPEDVRDQSSYDDSSLIPFAHASNYPANLIS